MFDEETLEKITMEILSELNYSCINGYDLIRDDLSKVILEEDLISSIEKLNPKLNDNQIREVLRLIKNLDNNNTIINNKQFTKYLLEGCKIPITEKGETKYITVNLVDFNNSSNNIFKAINQCYLSF